MSAPRRSDHTGVRVSVDAVVFTINRQRDTTPEHWLELLVVHRDEARRGSWALPGSLVRAEEDLPDAVVRTVFEESGIALSPDDVHQVAAFGDPRRDPRGRSISVAHTVLLADPGPLEPRANADDAQFLPYRYLRNNRGLLEFDHADIIYSARKTALRLLEESNAAFSFVPPKFTMTQLRTVYEAFLQSPVDPANFRRKVEAVEGFVIPLDELSDSTGQRGRPAQMYRAGRLRRRDINPPIRFPRTRYDTLRRDEMLGRRKP